MSVIGQGIILGGKKGNPVAAPNDVIFYDYDGTILYSYSAAEFANLSAMPANPTHEGLTSEGWNWSLNDAKTYVETAGGLDIGQMYQPTDGKTHLYVQIRGGRRTVCMSLAVNGTAVIDWGDNSTADTITGTSTSTLIDTMHTFPDDSDYDISVAVTGSAKFTSNAQYSKALWKGSGTVNENIVYNSFIKRIVTGNNIIVGSVAFFQCASMESVVLSKGLTALETQGLDYCDSLRHITFPDTITSIGNYFARCMSIRSVSTPRSCDLGNYFCANRGSLRRYCSAVDGKSVGFARYLNTLQEYLIGPSVKSFNSPIDNNYSLASLVFPPGITSYVNTEIGSCSGLKSITIMPTIPPLAGSSANFTNLPTDCVLYVPYASLASYLSATNYPAPALYTYVGFATYASGATLPTHDNTQAYNVVWYATKADAIAQTNAISTGNGDEIYCRYTAA